MATIDLVFEGGGAKGMAFAGALDVLLQEHTPARLLGTSAGAISAVLLAAGYTVPELMTVMEEEVDGHSVFATFLGEPEPFDQAAIEKSAMRQFLRNLDLPFVPEFVESRLDDTLTRALAQQPRSRHLFSFVERGGWYSAGAFVPWLEKRLNRPTAAGSPRNYGSMRLQEFYQATGVDFSVIVSDTTGQRKLILNHNTAPECPIVWTVRMSMNIPLLWEEVAWQADWGPYRLNQQEYNLTGHLMVDGGMLSNFPIALFLAPQNHVARVMGQSRGDVVLGLLIDDAAPVPQPQERGLNPFENIDPYQLETVKRILRLLNTMMQAHDNAAKDVFPDHVVRLPAGGYGTTEFDMVPAKRQALVKAGREATRTYLQSHAHLFGTERGASAASIPTTTTEIAGRIADDLLGR